MSIGFASVDEVKERFFSCGYICGTKIATTVYLSLKMQKPLLIEGPAGVGKTELAKVLAESQGLELVRLQCYEGLDESKALYEWEYAKQLLYTQILKEKIAETLSGAPTLASAVDLITSQDDAFFSSRFLLPRPLLKAITADRPNVLLIDEVDKSDPEFEAFLLEVLSDFQVSIPELGTVKATFIPLVILTSNNTRQMTDALKRRCLHLNINFPSEEEELRIVRLKVPGVKEELASRLVAFIHKVRALELKKSPSISETLDWARALLILNIEVLDSKVVDETINVLLKYEGDIQRVNMQMGKILGTIH